MWNASLHTMYNTGMFLPVVPSLEHYSAFCDRLQSIYQLQSRLWGHLSLHDLLPAWLHWQVLEISSPERPWFIMTFHKSPLIRHLIIRSQEMMKRPSTVHFPHYMQPYIHGECPRLLVFGFHGSLGWMGTLPWVFTHFTCPRRNVGSQ